MWWSDRLKKGDGQVKMKQETKASWKKKGNGKKRRSPYKKNLRVCGRGTKGREHNNFVSFNHREKEAIGAGCVTKRRRFGSSVRPHCGGKRIATGKWVDVAVNREDSRPPDKRAARRNCLQKKKRKRVRRNSNVKQKKGKKNRMVRNSKLKSSGGLKGSPLKRTVAKTLKKRVMGKEKPCPRTWKTGRVQKANSRRMDYSGRILRC